MKDVKGTFNVLASVEKHIEALKPLLPKQAVICIGEYPIKAFLKENTANRDGIVPILMEKSSDDIYKWLPKGYKPQLVVGYEDAGIDTHFWYNVLPNLAKDHSILDNLNKKSTQKLRGAMFFASVSDGVGSAALPSLITKFKAQTIDSLSIAVLPSKIQPADAHFNAYSTLQMCQAVDDATVLLLSRDQLEAYEGVDRRGIQLKGNAVVNYLLEVFLDKELLVEEVAELSRTFNVKLFSALAVTAASYRIYGSLENMLNAALLKPLSKFDLSSASLLYVLLRMPTSLRETIPRTQIELEITRWFKEKTTLQSIHISEPVYTEDSSDRIDAVLFIGGFDITQMFSELDRKVAKLKKKAVEKGFLTENWEFQLKFDEPKPPEPEPAPEFQPDTEVPQPTEITPPPQEQTPVEAEPQAATQPEAEIPPPEKEATQQAPAEIEPPIAPDLQLEATAVENASATEVPAEPIPEVTGETQPTEPELVHAEPPQPIPEAQPAKAVEAEKPKPKRTWRFRKPKEAPPAPPENNVPEDKPKKKRRFNL
jgi:hypothetical protein